MGKVFKGFLISLLSVICLACVGFAAACSKEPNYYIIEFENAEGVEFVCEITSGYEVREGAEVSFTLNVADNAIGEPLVRANDAEVKADDNGVYKFIIKEDTKVTVSNVYVISPYKINFDPKNNRVVFRGENGEALDTLSADEGTVIKFTIDVSVYHDRTKDFDVSANSVLLKPVDGVYSFTVTNDTTVSLGADGLDIAKGFIERPNTGSGTKDDPFLISEPVDLFYMRELINDDFNSGRFGAAHYKLTNDIDLEGEQLFVLGNGASSQLSYISGSFDGCGHTISNYYISETEYDSQGNKILVPYVGMFGYASATAQNPVEIKNLNLKDFTVNIDGAQEGGASFFAGGLLGYGVGVEITNCNVQGKITANGPEANNFGYFGYVGGVAGYLMSAYGSEQLKYNSSVTACGSDVEIRCNSGWMYGAGGLVGVLDSADDKANSYILNSYAANNVSGAVYTGGLAGYMGAYSSISNSYFSGNTVESNSHVSNVASGLGRYAHSYAGGLAGYVSYDCVISDSFTFGSVSAYSDSGSGFGHSGEIAGYLEEDGAYMVEANAAALINTNYFNGQGLGKFNKEFALNTLKWIESDWNFDGEMPVPSGAPKGKFSLKVVLGNDESQDRVISIDLSGGRNMAQLYEETSLDEFSVETIAGKSLRSYGYYFDKELKLKVPYGYVPSGDVTLYTGFADYSEVAGRYYLFGGEGAYLDLGTDGTLLYRNGALSHTTFYTYDGSKITLYENAAFAVVERRQISESEYVDSTLYFCATATLQDGRLTIVNIANGYEGSAVKESSHYYDSKNPLSGIKELDNFVYGIYYNGITQYIFNEDGTGSFGSNTFTYSVEGSVLSTSLGGSMSKGVVTDGYVTKLGTVELSKYDAFGGIWESAASSHRQYEFNGLGGYTYSVFDYVKSADGKTVAIPAGSPVTGVYTVSHDNMLTLDDGTVFSFDEDGYLTASYATYTETYYAQNSFKGEWRFFNTNEAIGLTFNGIGKDGYGTGRVTYGADTYESDFEYEAVTVTVDGDEFIDLLIYTEDSLIGRLRYTVNDNTLRGEMYSFYYGQARSGVIFCMYDDFRGKWISDEFGVVEFNGLGNYNLGGGTTGIIKTRGEVTVNGVYAGEYVLEGYNLKGTFGYKGKTYTIEYDVANKLIKVSESGISSELVALDDLYNIKYVAANGDIYEFNGGGYIVSGGKLYKNGDLEYSYKVTDGGEVEIYEKDGTAKIGSFALSVADNAFVLTAGEERVTLTYDNPFTGTWVIGGASEGLLEIYELGADLTASGKYGGFDVVFTYDAESKTMSFTFHGEKRYVYSYTVKDVTELKMGTDSSDANSVICVKADRVSPLRGVYTASADKKIYLDGMNVSMFGKGTAVLYDVDGAVQYTYKLDGNNVVLSGGETLVLKPVKADAAGAYVNGDKAFELRVPDVLFNKRVADLKKTTYYKFDGVGGVTATANGADKIYSYVINGFDEVKRIFTLTLTDEDGTKYTAIYEFTGSAVITVTEKTEA